ncbi:sigma-70 factor domain-containing protein, partial [Nocardia fluminea]|uniref:sigma-70 factor domain-containing protein n=1 Tax=Nocardia fluminea TaxID=134984 RepID=UPI0036731DC5
MTSPATTRLRPSEADIDAQSPAADLVRVYLNGIGRTALLTAADEVELAKRIEAGLYAQNLGGDRGTVFWGAQNPIGSFVLGGGGGPSYTPRGGPPAADTTSLAGIDIH